MWHIDLQRIYQHIRERTGIWKVTVALSVGVSDIWQNKESTAASNNIEGTLLVNVPEDSASTEEINKKTRTPFYPKEWKDSFGLPVEEHRKALEINMLKGYAEFTTPK